MIWLHGRETGPFLSFFVGSRLAPLLATPGMEKYPSSDPWGRLFPTVTRQFLMMTKYANDSSLLITTKRELKILSDQ